MYSDENIIGLPLQEILPDNNNVKAEKMLVANPPNILKRAKSQKNQESVSKLSFHVPIAMAREFGIVVLV